MALRKRVALRISSMDGLIQWTQRLQVAIGLGDDEAVVFIQEAMIEVIKDMYVIDYANAIKRYNDLVRGIDMIQEVN